MNLIGKKESRWHQTQIDKYQGDPYTLKIIHLDNLLLYLSSNNYQIFDLLNSKWTSVSRSGNSSFSDLRNNPSCVTTDQRTIYFLGNNRTLHSLTLKKNPHPYMDIDWILECKSTNKNLPPLRNNCTIEYFKDCIYIFGGTGSDKPRDELFIYDLKKECYFQFGLTDIKPEARHSHSSLLHNEKMFIFGGEGENRTYLYDLWEWDMKTNNGWKKIFPRHHQGLFPFPRSLSLIHAFDDMIFICKGKAKEVICEDLLCYNITSGRWEDLTLEENFPLDGDLNLFTVHNKNLIVGKGRELYQIDLNLILKGTKVSSLKENPLDSVDSTAEDQISKQMKPSYKEIYNKKEFTDVVFRVEGQEFKAHKAVLAGRSKYFKNVFASGMSESQNQIVDVPNIKASIFKAILEFIYCDETRITEETALDLLKLASEYALDKLKMECEIVLVNSLKLSSAIDTANTADAHEAAYLKEKTLDFILSNIDRINETDDITRLKRNLLLDLLKKQKN